ncbi:MAG: hypothetical protein NUV77_23525 [Thermoguttaceae bacterium]|jgi:hypothetical protein|nr:hypothetical protein [Thermoguttaceae bacterium]
MDSFQLCLAFGPVAVYLLLLGAVNGSRRALVVSGARDLAALALASSGLVIVGPMQLFFPLRASVHYGAMVWLFLIALYVLAVVMVVLLMRPRLVIYNIAPSELRPVLAELAAELDPDARWAGDALALPHLGVQLHLDNVAALRNVSLVSSGPVQNHQGWRRLELALAARLAGLETPRNPRAVFLLAAGALVAVVLVMTIARDPQAVAQSLFEMLRW